MDLRTRPATHDDHDAVVAFTEHTWDERSNDYIPYIYHDWIDGEDTLTLVAETDEGEIAGIAQGVLLSEWEAWGQGMRVNPDFRGVGASRVITHDLFDWAREQGASVLRNMVFSWNEAGLGSSRGCGYDPLTEFRWATPEPRATEPALEITDDVNAAWRFWRDSDACAHLKGLALDFGESWAVSEVTRVDLQRAADETALLVVRDDGTRGMAYRVRDYERNWDDNGNEMEPERIAEYAVGAWDSVASAEALFDAISADAGRVGADRTRVLIPETVGFVSDAVYVRAGVAEEPDFVLGADLTSDYRNAEKR